MKHKDFINRKEEIHFLQEAYAKARAQLLLLYGRRRVGKTCLIEHFLKDRQGIYFLCSKGNETEQIELLSSVLAEHFGDSALKLSPFREWHSLFLYLDEKAKKTKLLLAIDEFPFLMQSNPAITSILMKYWDEYLSKTNAMLILCGSSISMMESAGIDYNAPLYGRRTGQWKLMPLKFHNYAEIFRQEKNVKEIIEFYSITGGIAFYANELQTEKTARENIMSNIAKKGKLLYEEGEILVKEELKDSPTYFSVLHAIAAGKSKQGEIANAIGIPVTSLSKYLAVLARLNFVKRAAPVTERPNSKKSIYIISDNFLRFWFKFIYPNRVYAEENNIQKMENALKEFNAYAGTAFESICAEALSKFAPFEAEKTGKWWGAYRDKSGARITEEIDLVAINTKSREILFAECKWQDNVDAVSVLAKLKEKAALVDWKRKNEHYAVFARSFKRAPKEKGVFCFNLADISRRLGINTRP